MSIGTTDHGQRPLRRALTALCLTQVTSWGCCTTPSRWPWPSIAADTGWSETAVTAAFSTGLMVSAAAGIPVGRMLDRYGPRPVMTGGSLLAVPALVLVALAPNLAVFFAGWILAGVAMAAVFYQAAFAALTRWYGPRRVRALTTLTLAGGLASTLFAPVTDAAAAAPFLARHLPDPGPGAGRRHHPGARPASHPRWTPTPAPGSRTGSTGGSGTSCAAAAFCSCADG